MPKVKKHLLAYDSFDIWNVIWRQICMQLFVYAHLFAYNLDIISCLLNNFS